MPFTVGPVFGTSSAGAATQTATIAIPAGATVAVVISLSISGASGLQGTLTDNNLVPYNQGNFITNSGNNVQVDTFYNVNVPAATSLIYTAPAATTRFNNEFSAWVLVPSGGTVSQTDSKALGPFSVTGTDGCTTGVMTVTSADSIALGHCFDSGGANITAGTGFTLDGSYFGTGQVIFEHKAVAANAAATWTDTVASELLMIGGLAFSIAASGGGGATSTQPSTPIAAVSGSATANTAPFWGSQYNQFVQLQIANETSGWAFVNFGVVGSIVAATVAASFPVAPNSAVVVSVAPEVNGASVILSTGAGNVTFTRMTHEPTAWASH